MPNRYLRVMGVTDRSMAFGVRAGKASDMPRVLSLIRELATYERAAEEVTLTVEQLTADLQSGRFVVSIAETVSGKVVGMALHHARYSTWKGPTWYLEDLIVTEAWRGKGIGKALFMEVAAKAREENASRLEWQVLDWNEPALNFYRSLEARLDHAWINGKWTKSDLARNAEWTQNNQEP